MTSALSFRIPARASTSQNARFLSPFARAAVVKKERKVTRLAWQTSGITTTTPTGRLLVKLTRIGPNELDDDNLRASLKSFRDEVALLLGFPDDSHHLLRWAYEQRSDGHAAVVDAKTGRKKRLGIFAVEVIIRPQVCPDCHVEHCDCLHRPELCGPCSEVAL